MTSSVWIALALGNTKPKPDEEVLPVSVFQEMLPAFPQSLALSLARPIHTKPSTSGDIGYFAIARPRPLVVANGCQVRIRV